MSTPTLGRLSSRSWVAPTPDQARRDRWCARLAVALCLTAIAPPLIDTLSAPKSRSLIGQTDVPLDPWSERSLIFFTLAVYAIVVGGIIANAANLRRDRILELVILVAPWLVLLIRDMYAEDHLGRTVLFYPAVVTTLWLLRPSIRVVGVVGRVVGYTAVVSVALGAGLPSRGIYQSAAGGQLIAEKQILPWGTLVGPFSNGNSLGQFLLLGMVCMAFVPRRSERAVLLVVSAFALVWSASRAEIGGLGLVALTAFVLSFLGRRRRTVAAVAFVALSLGIGVVLPLTTTDPGAFSNRGYIWKQSLSAWSIRPILGFGTDYYSQIATTSATLGGTVYHAHNEFLQLLVTGGALLVGCVAALLLLGLRAAVRLSSRGFVFPAAYLVALGAACWLEVSFPILDPLYLAPVVTFPLGVLLLCREAGGRLPERGRMPAPGPVAGKVLARWWIPIAAVALGGLVGVGVNAATTPSYLSTLTLYVGVPGGAGTSVLPADTLQLSRVNSYVELLQSTQLASSVITATSLPMTVAEVQRDISASAKLNTAVIQVKVVDSSEARSAAIAAAVGERFGGLVVQLTEQFGNAGRSTVHVISGPTSDLEPVTPSRDLNLEVGLLLGFTAAGFLVLARPRAGGSSRRRDVPQSTVHVDRTRQAANH